MPTPLDDFNGPVTLMAASNDDKQFMGLIAVSQGGMYARGDGAWHTITEDNPYFAGVNVIDVDSESVDLFDKLDAKGLQPTIEQMAAYKATPAKEEDSDSE